MFKHILTWLAGLAMGTGLLVGPAAAADLPGRVPRVGVLIALHTPESFTGMDAFADGLRESGYVEGRNIIVDRRAVQGRPRLFQTLADLYRIEAQKLIDAGAEVIFAPTNAGTYGAFKASENIPIVFASVMDPDRGPVSIPFTHVPRMVTGVTVQSEKLNGKRLEILHDAFPNAVRMAVLYDELQRKVCGLELEDLRKAADRLNLQLQEYPVDSVEELERAFAKMSRARIDAIVVPFSLTLGATARRVAELSAQYRIPVLHEMPDFAEVGGLLSFGPRLDEAYRRAGNYVARILKGAKPADLPLEYPSRFELVVSLKTARAMKIILPEAVLARADRIIE